ncbi:hypothetical protein ANN_20732 [Periplaneta americana]|uniref:Uncharacterized protein n=1 Tax=Periplaneta americana TaxID=6978 RepID=A0ABQ8SDE1_PERAM|nr:hypothetical protein ANN_20732 [Periplaneta americana]
MLLILPPGPPPSLSPPPEPAATAAAAPPPPPPPPPPQPQPSPPPPTTKTGTKDYNTSVMSQIEGSDFEDSSSSFEPSSDTMSEESDVDDPEPRRKRRKKISYTRSKNTTNHLLPSFIWSHISHHSVNFIEYLKKSATATIIFNLWLVDLFVKLIKEHNIALFKPNKDECDLCLSYKLHNVSDDDYNAHQLKKERARQEKSVDKKEAEEVAQRHVLITFIVCYERIPNLTGEQSDGITVFRIPPMTSLMLHRCRTGAINLWRWWQSPSVNLIGSCIGRELADE